MAGTSKGSLAMQTSEVLNKAADLIEERGWQTGPRGMTGEGGLCLMGAVFAAQSNRVAESDLEATHGFVACPAGAAVYEHVKDDRYVHSPLLVWAYNDRIAKSSTDVLGVLRACALIEAAREEQGAAWETYAEQVTA